MICSLICLDTILFVLLNHICTSYKPHGVIKILLMLQVSSTAVKRIHMSTDILILKSLTLCGHNL